VLDRGPYGARLPGGRFVAEGPRLWLPLLFGGREDDLLPELGPDAEIIDLG
jgi:hypothetical protein